MADKRRTDSAIIISALTGLILVLFNLPSAIAQWSPYLEAFLNTISPTILNWTENLLIAGFSFVAGWYLKSLRNESVDEREDGDGKTGATPSRGKDRDLAESSPDQVRSIEGCIEVGEVLWRGTAYLANGQLEEVDAPFKAICPDCQTLMYDHERESVPVVTSATTYWECPSCDHRTEDNISKYDDAVKLFETHFERIVESDDEVYSLDNLIQTTPQEIWENYADVISDPNVSTDCFY